MSEDDNVFSPNFLEYVNKGLELFKNDKSVFAIVGYNNSFECKHDENNHFAQYSMFQAWGYGIWENRFVEAREKMTPSYFKNIIHCLNFLYTNLAFITHIIGVTKELNKNFIGILLARTSYSSEIAKLFEFINQKKVKLIL